MDKELLNETFSYFELATKGENPLLKFEVEDNYLTVYYHETLTAEGKDWKWTILCAQSLENYAVCSGVFGSKVVERVKTKELVNRITLMLAEKLRSTKQDCNVIMQDYTLIRK